MEYGIRWKQGDYIKLGQAVSNFNKKIRELERENQKLYLPLEIKYSEVKENIKTRNELNRVIKNLRKFKEEGQEDLYVTEGGEKLTKWEYNIIKNISKQAKINLNKELNSINRKKVPYITSEERVIRGTIRNIEKIENVKGAEFLRIKSRLNYVGSSDYEYKKALIWRNNYYKTIENYSTFDGYKELIKFLQRFNNPITFYNYVKDTTTGLIDDYLKAMSKEQLVQAQFNKLLYDLGVSRY